MALLFYSRGGPVGHAEAWRRELGRHLPDLEVRVWPDEGDLGEIRYVLVWMHDRGALRRYPNLEAILSLGAGVEHVLDDPDLPEGVPIVRLVDPLLTAQMVEYVTLEVLRHHRRAPDYAANQARARWEPLPPPDTGHTTVGILGLGEMGRACAEALARFGFPVAGWSRRPKSLPGIACHHGPAGLEALLRMSRILVCLLPLTPETRSIVDARALALLPKGAALISAGRGGHVVDADLLAALDAGHLEGASLDVFNEEPLPPDHPYWRHPGVVVTPHVASETIPRSAAASLAAEIGRLEAGEPPRGLVDIARGY